MKLCNARWRQFNSHLPRNANSRCHFKGTFYQSVIKCFILMALNLTHQCMKRFGNVFLMRCELPCEVYVYATPRGWHPQESCEILWLKRLQVDHDILLLSNWYHTSIGAPILNIIRKYRIMTGCISTAS